MSVLNGFIIFFLFLSAGISVGIIVSLFWHRSRKKKRVYGLSRLMAYSAVFIGSVWSLRYAVGLFSIGYPALSEIAPKETLVNLNAADEFFNSFIHALQTFSMDEDYTVYISTGKTMIRELFGETSFGQIVFGVYASVMNAIAPVAGGAIIFEILASIFPGLRLRWHCFWKRKKIYYFSELNEYSLALAKSIVEAGDRRTLIVFTDAYVDNEDEKSTEQLNEAKDLNAICLKDDLSYVIKNKLGRKHIFLMDKDETGNLQTLTELANSDNSQYIKDSLVYLFVNDDAYVQVEKNVCKKLWADWKPKDMKDEDQKDENLPISIIPVRSYRNMISNLLVDYPLYEPLIGKKSDGPRKLTVTILGTGHIGMEMFLSTYWCGQMLDCELVIRIVSQEKEEDFWGKIDRVNPEIRRTTNADDSILQIYPEIRRTANAEDPTHRVCGQRSDRAKPYCEVKYMECDVWSSAFIQSLQMDEGPDDISCKEADKILDTDYFFVALGSDEENISVANILRKYMAEYRIKQAYVPEESEESGDEKAAQSKTEKSQKNREIAGTEDKRKEDKTTEDKRTENRLTEDKPTENKSTEDKEEKTSDAQNLTVITYVVYNTALAETLNQTTSFPCCNNAKIYMRAVGSLEEVYSRRNIFLDEHEASAQAIHDSYLAIQKENDLQNMKSRIKDDYKYWANVARHCHVKYKMFSMGVIEKSWLDDKKYDKKAREQMEDVAYRKCQDMVAKNINKMTEAEKTLMHRMAWLEHRRWNAFTRVMGFRSCKAYSVYAKEKGSYKEMEIKLHPCLLECDEKGIRLDENGDGTAKKKPVAAAKNGKKPEEVMAMGFDRLDYLSYDLYRHGYNDYDMKQYDYPDEDFCSGMKPRRELTVLLQEDQERKEKAKEWLRLYAVTDRTWAVAGTPEKENLLSRHIKKICAKIGVRKRGGTDAQKRRGTGAQKRDVTGAQTLEEQVQDALDGGVTCVQLREKGISQEELQARADRMAKVCHDRKKRIPFIVNDNVDVAVKCGADGVHVGQDDMPISKVRKLVGQGMIIGASAHTVEEAKAAEADGADYLGVGSVFTTSTKADVRPLSMETLREICEAVDIPVVAIGGIKKENAMQLAGSGVDGIAVVSAIFAAEDCGKAAGELREIADQVTGKNRAQEIGG